MSIQEIEAFYRGMYGTRWEASVYWDLVGRMNIPPSRKLTQLSCGQRSQVTLGVLLAQRPEVLILDDYSLGLDVGYRRLFLQALRAHMKTHPMTVLLTSHIVSELESVLDEVLILKKGKLLGRWDTAAFAKAWHAFRMPIATFAPLEARLRASPHIENIECDPEAATLYTTLRKPDLYAALQSAGVSAPIELKEVPLTFEDTFLGVTGLY